MNKTVDAVSLLVLLVVYSGCRTCETCRVYDNNSSANPILMYELRSCGRDKDQNRQICDEYAVEYYPSEKCDCVPD